MTLRVLHEDLGLSHNAEQEAIVEAVLMLSPECVPHSSGWVLAAGNRNRKVLAELRRHADASGKRIFRLSSALSGLPAQEQPTIEELRIILEAADGEFELMPNGMVKRVSRA